MFGRLCLKTFILTWFSVLSNLFLFLNFLSWQMLPSLTESPKLKIWQSSETYLFLPSHTPINSIFFTAFLLIPRPLSRPLRVLRSLCTALRVVRIICIPVSWASRPRGAGGLLLNPTKVPGRKLQLSQLPPHPAKHSLNSLQNLQQALWFSSWRPLSSVPAAQNVPPPMQFLGFPWTLFLLRLSQSINTFDETFPGHQQEKLTTSLSRTH